MKTKPFVQMNKTNADRIRGLSDEALASFLAEWNSGPKAWRREYGEIKSWLQEVYVPKEATDA